MLLIIMLLRLKTTTSLLVSTNEQVCCLLKSLSKASTLLNLLLFLAFISSSSYLPSFISIWRCISKASASVNKDSTKLKQDEASSAQDLLENVPSSALSHAFLL